MTVDISDDSKLEALLIEVGEFGIFQVVTLLLICIPNIISATSPFSYMFIANTFEYRCKVPYCDVVDDSAYNQSWVQFAIPSSNGKIENCASYAPLHGIAFNTSSVQHFLCSADSFNTSEKITCSEYVHESNERNLQTEFNIHCSDSYKLALVGTVNNVGRFLFLPLTGLLSDKFGRLTVVIIGMMTSSIFGIIKSFSMDYFMYITFEFLEAAAGTCTFAGTYVLALELVSSKYRVVGCTLIAISYSLGEILLGLVAMYIHDFRNLIRVLYTPGLLVILYFWLIPESIRWLLITGRVERAVKILKRIALVNGKKISETSIVAIKLRYSRESITKNSSVQKADSIDSESMFQSLCSVFKSKKLCIRFINCCYQWITCCFCYYGVGLISTHVHGENRYTSFLLVASLEIPSIFITLPLLKCINRKVLMFGTLAITACSTIVTPWIPQTYSTIVLVLFMLAKAAMAAAFAVLYIFTAEQWPTNLRTTIMNLCSMIGRIGAMLAPLTLILVDQYESLPAFLFGIAAIFGAIFVLFSPETFEKKLPDTIEEAKQL